MTRWIFQWAWLHSQIKSTFKSDLTDQKESLRLSLLTWKIQTPSVTQKPPAMMQIPSALISCVKEGSSRLCLESFQVIQALPGEKSLPRGKSLQVILASLWEFPSGSAFVFLMRGWKINGCVLRSVCQQMPGLAKCRDAAYPHRAAQMLRLPESKPAQVSLLSTLPVDTVGTCSHSGPFASQAPGAVTSNQRQ